jgi:hypothetical protein
MKKAMCLELGLRYDDVVSLSRAEPPPTRVEVIRRGIVAGRR